MSVWTTPCKIHHLDTKFLVLNTKFIIFTHPDNRKPRQQSGAGSCKIQHFQHKKSNMCSKTSEHFNTKSKHFDTKSTFLPSAAAAGSACWIVKARSSDCWPGANRKAFRTQSCKSSLTRASRRSVTATSSAFVGADPSKNPGKSSYKEPQGRAKVRIQGGTP